MNLKFPSISVVIPCYNVEKYIGSSVKSVLGQSYPISEFVCVDDGSTDKTLSILKSIKASGANLKIISQTNLGASAARNRGLSVISGAYVQFLDADDLLHQSKLMHQARLIAASNYEPDIVAGRAKRTFVDEPGRGSSTDNVHDDDWTGLILTRLGNTCSNLWKTSAVRAVGGWNESVHQSDDAELTFRMLKRGARVLRDPKVLTTLRRREHSLSNRDKVESARAWLELRRKIHTYLLENGQLTEERKEALLRTVFFRLHFLHDKDPVFARKMHRQLIPEDYQPTDPWLGLGRVYNLLYRLFGFSRAERLHRYWLSLRRLFS